MMTVYCPHDNCALCVQGEGVLDKDLEATVSILSDFSAEQQLTAVTRTLTFLHAFTNVHEQGNHMPHTHM